ncbi:hypothetical protein XENORESO_016135 [Xenotaenia resolanae]|uniref:Uncharacterized protein n=1 Tax=Xenotaenia resolanae TaxID=208358 RepID=A0ABV0WZ91_9TELE
MTCKGSRKPVYHSIYVIFTLPHWGNGDKLPVQVSQQQRLPVTLLCNSMHVCGRARTIQAHSRDAKTSMLTAAHFSCLLKFNSLDTTHPPLSLLQLAKRNRSSVLTSLISIKSPFNPGQDVSDAQSPLKSQHHQSSTEPVAFRAWKLPLFCFAFKNVSQIKTVFNFSQG